MEYHLQNALNNIFITYLVDDRYRLLRHGCFLTGLLVLFYSSDSVNQFSGVYKLYFLLAIWITFIAMFYINMYVLVPFFFFKSKYLLYFILLILLVSMSLSFGSYLRINFFTHYNLHKSGVNNHHIKGLLDGVIITVPFIMTTTTLKLFQRWIKDTRRISDLKNLTLTMELNELKNQINPHFLFNTLNNVKALIRKDPKKATEVIQKLSEFLRYQLYENNVEKTSLASEIQFISNFLNLEEIRRDNFSVEFVYEPNFRAFHQYLIPPNLFITFVENAVKHSCDITEDKSFIRIRFAVEQNQLHFTCINSKKKETGANDNRYNGLGLKNIKRRLNLLYENKSTLDIQSEETTYTVNLTLPLS